MNGFYHIYLFIVHILHMVFGLPVSDKAIDDNYIEKELYK